VRKENKVSLYIYIEKGASLNRGLYRYLGHIEFSHVFPFRIQNAVDLRLIFRISFFYSLLCDQTGHYVLKTRNFGYNPFVNGF
jgi:hypothetical protein